MSDDNQPKPRRVKVYWYGRPREEEILEALDLLRPHALTLRALGEDWDGYFTVTDQQENLSLVPVEILDQISGLPFIVSVVEEPIPEPVFLAE